MARDRACPPTQETIREKSSALSSRAANPESGSAGPLGQRYRRGCYGVDMTAGGRADESRIRTIASVWAIAAGIFYCYDILRDTGQALTAGGRPLGDDFVNFWSGAHLAWSGRAADVYDWPAYHAFQVSIVGPDLGPYNYSYSPILLLLTAALAALPYLPGLAAWVVMSWLAFWRALRLALPERGAVILALATPAVFVNAYSGQNGSWTAALLGGGLCLLERRPAVAGALLGLLIYKPHLGLLIPLALVAGRQWRALAGASVTAVLLIALSVALVGPGVWSDYLHHADDLRRVAIEHGAGVWHRTISVFVLARNLGADVATAYATQALTGAVAAVIVALAWWRDAPASVRYTLLVLGTFLATPYLQDYDIVVGAFVVVWLMATSQAAPHLRKPAFIASALILVLPLFASILANATGIALGALFMIPAFVLAARVALFRSDTKTAQAQSHAWRRSPS
jgi:arabinofuranan 3-O-arabinosyltransferase